MGYDVSCCLCGVAAKSLWNPLDPNNGYDPRVISEEELVWLGDVSIIGLNEGSQD